MKEGIWRKGASVDSTTVNRALGRKCGRESARLPGGGEHLGQQKERRAGEPARHDARIRRTTLQGEFEQSESR